MLRRVRCPGGLTIAAPGVGPDPATRAALARFAGGRAAITAVRCTIPERNPGTAARGELQVATGGVAGLVRALEQPDVPPSTRPAGTACAAYAELAPALLLVDDHGHFLRPRLPLDYCAHFLQEARTALARVTWRTVSSS